MTHMLALLLVPILWGCWPKTIHVRNTVCCCLSLPGKCVCRNHMALSLIHLVGQLTNQRLHPQLDLHHGSKLHILGWTAYKSFLLEVILSLI
jgi:hypothetical protein